MITVKGKGALVGMLADLALTASTDDALKFLANIRLHTADGRLHGWSTDRYRAGHASAECDGELAGPVEIKAADVANLVRQFRTGLAVSIDVGESGTVEFSSPGGPCVTVHQPDEPSSIFGLMRSVAVEELPESNSPLKLDGKFLAAFAKIAQRRKEYVQIVGADGSKPAHIGVGPDYRAWLMPVFGGKDHDWAWLSPAHAEGES